MFFRINEQYDMEKNSVFFPRYTTRGKK